MSTVIWLLVLLVAIAVAFFAGRYMAPRTERLRDMERERDAARTELRTYREEVNTHFEKTAHLFNEVTGGYRALYEHLAAGSQRLGLGPDATLLSARPEKRQLQERLDTDAAGGTPDADAAQEEKTAPPAPDPEPASADPTEAEPPPPESSSTDPTGAQASAEAEPEERSAPLDSEKAVDGSADTSTERRDTGKGER
ncbi:MAG: DUF1043 family protein [Aquisalimonadaceae bacterium]